MSIFSIERNGFVDCKVLANSILKDLDTNGFTRIFPSAALSNSDVKATFEAGPTVDALATGGSAVTGSNPAQPWRLYIEAISESQLIIAAATPLQLDSTGGYTIENDGLNVSGLLGSKKNGVITPTGWQDVGNTVFFNRLDLAANERASSPISYRLSICSHGVSLFVWEPGNDPAGNSQSWFVIQRTVNNTTGVARTTGKSPIFCVFGIKRVSKDISLNKAVDLINRFVVRESDIQRPTDPLDATADGEDSCRIINRNNMVSITEDNNYVISFPNGLNTQRAAYPADELDLIAYTSADVISQNSDVSITVYGEATPRVYKAMSANGANNTGMRILLLASGGSV